MDLVTRLDVDETAEVEVDLNFRLAGFSFLDFFAFCLRFLAGGSFTSDLTFTTEN